MRSPWLLTVMSVDSTQALCYVPIVHPSTRFLCMADIDSLRQRGLDEILDDFVTPGNDRNL